MAISGVQYAANTPIMYYQHGVVNQGVLDQTANPWGKNLVVPKGSTVNFDAQGAVVNIPAMATTSAFFLGMNVRSAAFSFDTLTDLYKIRSGKIAAPMVVAMIPLEFDNTGSPTSLLPIIAPTDSDFTFPIDD